MNKFKRGDYVIVKEPGFADYIFHEIGTVLTSEEPYVVRFPSSSNSRFSGEFCTAMLFENQLEFAEIAISPLYKTLNEV